MKNHNTLLFFLFLFVGVMPKLSAQQVNCYSKGEFKSTYKVTLSDITYDFTIVFCKSAVNRFAMANDTDKVLLLTVVKNVGDKKGIGRYEAKYKIVSSKEDNEGKDSFYFVAELLKATKTEITAPDALNVKKLTMYLEYDNDTHELLLQDKDGKYFFKTVEKIEDDNWGW
jgi:hypothetical protein